MIDWDKTYQRFGIKNCDGYRPKMVCICDGCSAEAIITVRVKSRIKNGQMEWYCPKCVGNREEVREKLRSRTTEQWTNQSFRNLQLEKSRRLWNDEDYKNLISRREKEYYNQPEIKEALRDKYTALYATEDYKQKRREGSIALWKDPKFREKMALSIEHATSCTRSNLHDLFEQYLRDLGITRVSRQQLDNYDKCYIPEFSLGPYNFDYLVKFNNKHFLIELHGDYWHNLAESIERDKRKSSYVVEHFNYELYVIWEYEFYTKDRVLNRLKELLGIISMEFHDFSFNAIDIREIGSDLARQFLASYHYRCSLGRGGLKIGAFLGDELIAVIVYTAPIRLECAVKQGVLYSEILEISRLAIKNDRHKPNFASWFMRKTFRLIPDTIKKIIAFSDKTFGHSGTIYKATGFKFDGKVKRDYWYIDQRGWVMHKKTLYNHAQSLAMTEREFASKYNYKKTYGAEKLRFVLER